MTYNQKDNQFNETENQPFEPTANRSSQMTHPRITFSVGVPDDGGECLGSLPQPCFCFWICVALTPELSCRA